MSALRKRFGRLVAARRRQRGMTQQKLSDACGLSPQMIARIETGTTGVSMTSIEGIAAALDVDPAALFLDSPSQDNIRSQLADINSRLIGLSDRDLEWVDQLLDTALRSRG